MISFSPNNPKEFRINGFLAKRKPKPKTNVIIVDPMSSEEYFDIILTGKYTVQEFINRFLSYGTDEYELTVFVRTMGRPKEAADTIINIEHGKLNVIETGLDDFRNKTVIMVEGEKINSGLFYKKIHLTITTM